MKYEKLKIVYEVAKLGNISLAAKQLQMTQSALTKTIQQLESRLQKKLFTRSSKGVVLTREGKIVVEVAKRLIAEIDSIPRLLETDTTAMVGNIKLATTCALASMWLPSYLPKFLGDNPDLTLTIIASDEDLDIQARNMDAAIRPYVPHQTGYVQRYLTTFHMSLYASPEYLEKFGVPKTPKDLEQHRLLVFGEDTLHPYGNINWLHRLGANLSQEPYVRLNLGHGLLEMARKGLGIIALSNEYPALKETNLVPILTNHVGPTTDIYYIYPTSFESIKRITALGDYLSATLNKGQKPPR